MSPPPRTALLAACLAAAACAEAGEPVTTTDASGVAVVTHGAGAVEAAPRWRLDPAPLLDIRSREPEGLVLYRVTSVLPLEGGALAVANTGSQEVLVLDRGGGLIARLGGAGNGPGEFRGLHSLLALGDSLGAWDAAARRLSVFGPGGELVREVSFRERVEGDAQALLLPLDGGELALFTVGGLTTEPGRSRVASESFRVSADGEVLASYGRFPGNETVVAPPLMGPLLFGARTHAATVGDRLVVGLADAPELRWYEPSGELAHVVHWPDHERSVTQERFLRFVEAGLAEMPEAQRAAALEMASGMPRAEVAPAYEDLVASDSGHLWVGSYTGPEAVLPGARVPPRTWLVFGSGGALAATVETPEGFRLLAVRGGELLGVHTDELGVESVRVYRLAEGGGA